MTLKSNYIKRLTATLGMTEAKLLAQIQGAHPQKRFSSVFVVADEESRYVAIATYEVNYKYRGSPPSLVFAIHKDDLRVEEIDNAGYGLGIK